MKGTIYRKSRYSTVSAASHKPIPSEAPKTSTTRIGRKHILIAGIRWYQASNATKKTAEIRKSTKLVITLLTTTTSRGKYTFEIRFEFNRRLPPLSVIAVEKNCHGSIPQKTS